MHFWPNFAEQLIWAISFIVNSGYSCRFAPCPQDLRGGLRPENLTLFHEKVYRCAAEGALSDPVLILYCPLLCRDLKLDFVSSRTGRNTSLIYGAAVQDAETTANCENVTTTGFDTIAKSDAIFAPAMRSDTWVMTSLRSNSGTD
jgi:hypothetical protein